MSRPGDAKIWGFLERRAPWMGTPGVLKAVVLLNGLVFLLLTIDPAYAEALALDPRRILQGEVWRLVTYILIPETRDTFWIIFALLFLWFVSSALEDYWGPLRLNVFYLTGMAGCTVAAFFFGGAPSNTFLNLSLFFAFATVAPDQEIYLFFVLRVKMKHIAWVMAGILGLQFLLAPLPARMAMVASLANYLVFFGPGFLRDMRTRRTGAARLGKILGDAPESLHRCAACGRTEASDPALEFRVTASGDEYCTDHLPRS
jgi:membrane associated rhomboid family serine protease